MWWFGQLGEQAAARTRKKEQAMMMGSSLPLTAAFSHALHLVPSLKKPVVHREQNSPW